MELNTCTFSETALSGAFEKDAPCQFVLIAEIAIDPV
jgi:hypothetical protein